MNRRALTLLCLALAAPAHAEDKRDLDGMSVIGNQELPKSLIIVPWKPAELGAVPPAPESGLLNEQARPVDPVVFRRELEGYQEVRER